MKIESIFTGMVSWVLLELVLELVYTGMYTIGYFV